MKKDYYKEYYQKNKEKIKARVSAYKEVNCERVLRTGGASFKVAYAIKTGKIVPRPCEVCGAAKAQAHHDDYNKPLEVRWLCREHHEEWHKHNRPIYLTDKV